MSKQRIIRKKGDLTGAGKGDWLRVDIFDKQYKENYDRIFGKKNTLVENKIISKEDEPNRRD
tara:strand:- start:541 stop:726 length:186 start_codon:yes stop_codon:yes gene_type:complete